MMTDTTSKFSFKFNLQFQNSLIMDRLTNSLSFLIRNLP